MVTAWGLGKAWERDKRRFLWALQMLASTSQLWLLSEAFNSVDCLLQLGGKGSLE